MGIIVRDSDEAVIASIRELAEYLGESPIATAVNAGNSFFLLKEEWERANPKTPEEIRDYYRASLAYLWNLSLTNYAIPHQVQQHEVIAKLAAGDVLDIGAGIGSMILAAALAPNRSNLTHADVGGKTFEYAKWRYARRGLAVEMVELPVDYMTREHDPFAGRTFATVVCTEVIEHVAHPERLVRYLSEHTAVGGLLLATVSFSDIVPDHITAGKYTDDAFIRDVFPAWGFQQARLDCPYLFRRV